MTHLFASTFGHEPVSSTDNVIQKLEKFENDQLVQLSLSTRKTFDCIPLATNSLSKTCIKSRAVEPDFKKSNKKSDAQGWTALALVVILRCV